MQHATAPYIAFLDADDEWHRLKLEIQLAHIKNNRLGAVCTVRSRRSERKGPIFGTAFSRLNNLKLWSTTNVCCSSVLIDSGMMFNKPLMTAYKHSHDTSLVNGNTAHAIGGVKAPLVKYRVGHESATSRRFKTVLYNRKVFIAENGLLSGTIYWLFYITFATLKRMGTFRIDGKEIELFGPQY